MGGGGEVGVKGGGGGLSQKFGQPLVQNVQKKNILQC